MMDYKAMWDGLKDMAQERFNKTLDYTSKYIYKDILDNIKKLEERYCGDYICIKDYRGIKKGSKCDIIDQIQEDEGIMIQTTGTDNYEYISYKEFDIYFKEV